MTLCEGLEKIGKCAFYECLIAKIKIPSTIKKVDLSTFAHCAKLRRVKLQNGLEELGDHCFSGTGI